MKDIVTVLDNTLLLVLFFIGGATIALGVERVYFGLKGKLIGRKNPETEQVKQAVIQQNPSTQQVVTYSPDEQPPSFFTCPTCEKKFKQFGKDTDLSTGEEWDICPYCHMRVRKRLKLVVASVSQGEVLTIDEKKPVSSVIKKSSYTCPKCGSEFQVPSKQTARQQHVNYNFYFCPVCRERLEGFEE